MEFKEKDLVKHKRTGLIGEIDFITDDKRIFVQFEDFDDMPDHILVQNLILLKKNEQVTWNKKIFRF